ncbi:MAG TPA: DUF979 family protein, partial [Blastocatellia bacterium]|nr:DUF979 family protein [Blastocatellia bacterium]
MTTLTLADVGNVLFSLNSVYVLTGLVLFIFSWLTARDRENPNRYATACFWFTLGVIFALGSVMPHWLTGLLVLLMVGLDGAGRVGHKSRAEGTTKSGQ